MKKFYLFLISVLACSFLFANPVITAKQNGSWSDKNVWDKVRTPNDGDTIVIPVGKTVTFDDWLTTEALKNVYIKVYGSLKLGGLISSLSLDNKSTIVIYNGGILSTTGAWQSITLNGSSIFASTYPSIAGPMYANAASNGFVSSSNPLPVKFVGFTVTLKGNDALIQWSTASEANAYMYEVERSYDGINWNVIANVNAKGNTSSTSNYSYIDKNLSARQTYYRVREIDTDGSNTITTIQSVRLDASALTSDIKIAAIQNRVLLQFPEKISGNVVVRFVSASGQVADQQTIKNPIGQIVLNSNVRGIYVISITDGNQINTAKQVLL